MSTPVRRQYLELKAQVPDAILFFRLGDFYEMFDDDALRGSRELDLTLTAREFAKGERSPMCGVPYHAAENHIGRLVSRGIKVAICEQIGDPKASKGLVDREIVRIVTPGTAVEGGLVDPVNNRYLAAVLAHGETAGIAYTDVSTGELTVETLHGEIVGSLIERELSRIGASEVLFAASKADDEPPAWATGAYATACNAKDFATDTARRAIAQHYGLATIDGQPYASLPLAVGALGGLLAYLQRTQRALLPRLRPIEIYAPESHMILDAATRRNLEIDKTIRGGAAVGSLLAILDHTKTAMGARLLRRWVAAPLHDLLELRRRQEAIAAFAANTSLRLGLLESLRPIQDIERLAGRILQYTASPRDLAALAAALDQTRELVRTRPELATTASAEITACAQAIDPCTDVVLLIRAAVVDDPPATASTGFFIRDGFSEDVDSIEQAVRNARDWMAHLESKERLATGIRSLKVTFNKVFGYAIEVSNANKESVPGHYVRKQTLVNAERYITQELKEHESLILSADERRSALEATIMTGLQDDIAAQIGRIHKTAESLARLDVLASQAALAIERQYVQPVLNESTSIDIAGGRHPVVEVTQRETRFVPNDIHLDARDDQIMILTGPNMSGKSCYLRQTALIVLMAQMGLFVPAVSARIGLVDRIFTRVGAQDDISTGQSTFMVEMVETAAILTGCTERSLLILDEIGRGTSTYDGVAIAQAIIEYLHQTPKRTAKTIFATHYHELNGLAERLPRVRNFRMNVLEEGDEVAFLRQVVPGGADRSYGIHVAKLAGLPSSVTNRAKAILAELEDNTRPIEMVKTAAGVGQIPLFAETSTTNVAAGFLDDITTIDPDSMTPMQALIALADLRERILLSYK